MLAVKISSSIKKAAYTKFNLRSLWFHYKYSYSSQGIKPYYFKSLKERNMKRLTICLVTLSCIFIVTNCFSAEITKEQVIKLVDKTCEDIKADVGGTFEKIANAEHPYKDAQNPASYVFVYNTEVVIVAHPKKSLIGRSYKGKPDVRGKKFRDDIVNGALKNGTGWVDYSYKKPEEKGIHQKTTYYKLVTGSDGNKYVVASGKYL